MKVESTFSKPLERQVTEGISITNSKADLIMNSKSEYHQPAVQRVQTTREVRHGSWLYRTEFNINFAAQNPELDTTRNQIHNSKCHNFISILLHDIFMFLLSHSSVLARQGSFKVSEKLCSNIYFSSINQTASNT